MSYSLSLIHILQPSLASQGIKGTVTNALASAFVGSLGGGKSFGNNLLVYYSCLLYTSSVSNRGVRLQMDNRQKT